MYRYHTAVAIPASIVSDTPHLRERTAKLGVIARSCSIFGVDQIILYADDCQGNQKEDLALCEQILSYLETPQYLRKVLFQKSPGLQFVGILPPLQIPSHNVPKTIADCKVGDYREGVVLGRTQERLRLEVGLESPVESLGNLSKGTRATVKLTSITPHLAGDLVDRSKISISRSSGVPILGMPYDIYWGYQVHKAASLGKLLNDQTWGLRVGTSRYGTSIHEVLPSLSKALKTSQSTLIAFGSPKLGLKEILRQEELEPKDVFDYYVNTVPDQQTATVRTEEAVSISLGILNLAERLAG